VRVAGWIYIPTVIRKMYEMPCKMYLSGSEKRENEASAWNLPKISPAN
jgi:hypothetical protein